MPRPRLRVTMFNGSYVEFEDPRESASPDEDLVYLAMGTAESGPVIEVGFEITQVTALRDELTRAIDRDFGSKRAP